MFLSINRDEIIRTKDIIGVFNLDYIKNTREYRNFINNMKDKNEVLVINEEQEKTLILIQNQKNNKAYITNISANSIKKKIKSFN